MVRQARFFGGVVRHLGYGTTKWILMLLQDNKTDCLTSVLSLAGKPTRKKQWRSNRWVRFHLSILATGRASGAVPWDDFQCSAIQVGSDNNHTSSRLRSPLTPGMLLKLLSNLNCV